MRVYDKSATTIARRFHLIRFFALLTRSESPQEKIYKYPAIITAIAAKSGIDTKRISEILPRITRNEVSHPADGAVLMGERALTFTRKSSERISFCSANASGNTKIYACGTNTQRENIE